MASDFSRRDFLATGGAVVAGVFVPDWAAAFQPGTSDNARRTEVTDAALAHAAKIGASYADIRINRYRRESIATREQQVQTVSRSTSYGFGVRVLVNGAWGFAASNLVEPAAARTAAEQAVAIAKANAILAARKITLAHADRTVTTWTSAFKKDPFEVPLETKIAFLLKLNQTALVPGVSFVTSQILFADEQKYFASSEGSRITQRLIRTYPQFQTTATDRASGDFQTRPVVDRAKLMGYEYVEERRRVSVACGCREGRSRSRRETESQTRIRRPLRHRRRSVAAVPRHPRISRPLNGARSRPWLRSEQRGHQLSQAYRCGHAALWLEHRQHCRRSHATRRPCHHGL